jgi:hypothetical protein
LPNLGRVGGFEEQGEGLDETKAGSVQGLTIARYVEFRAEGHVAVSRALDDCCQAASLLLPFIIANIYTRSETFVFGM